MSLDASKLSSGLSSGWAAFPASPLAAAQAWANAYDAYAKDAVACSALGPTVVNLPGMISGLKDAFEAGGSFDDVADALASAHETYWTGAAFGATGAVTTIDGTSALRSALSALWLAQSITLTLFPASAAAHSTLIDTFTKTVKVKDTAVPAPSGCGPSPIS